MRILMLAQWYLPVIGGEENHVRSLAAALSRRGHEVSVATMAQPDQPDEDRDGDVRVHRIKASVQRLPGMFATESRQSAPPAPDPETVLAIRRILASEQPDIVHGHNWLIHSYLPPLLGRRPKVVLTLHDYSLICARKTLQYLGGEPCDGPEPGKCLRCASEHYGRLKGAATVAGLSAMGNLEPLSVRRFVAVSEAVASGNRLAGRRLPFEVIPNFIPDELPVDDEHELLRRLPAEPFLLFVGAMTRTKGIEVLLDAYRRMPDPPPLVLIGYRGAERIRGLEPPPPGVTVLTDLPRAAVMSAWRRAAVGVVPSVWADPCPTVAMEAMASGVPVVASDIGGLPDIVGHEQSGLLVPAGESAALASALTRLTRDEAIRSRLARGALERVGRFRESSVVPRIEGLYERLLAGSAKSAPVTEWVE